MPRGNGRGPMGSGPMTGRGAGFCSGNGIPGYMNGGVGDGPWAGGGRRGACRRGGFKGGRHGRLNRFFATGLPGWVHTSQYGKPGIDTDPELAERFLKARMESLQAEMDGIKKRLDENEKMNAAEG